MARYPVVAIMGARQVGKSTLCGTLAAEAGLAYRTLDDRDTLRQAREDPHGLLDEAEPDGAFIDEAQRAPELFLAIKLVVDQDPRPGRYLLSGSNQPRITAAVGDSLLGRAAYRTLRPLTLSELRFDDEHPGWSFLFKESESDVLAELRRRADASGVLDWRDVVMTGGFPRAVVAPADQRFALLNDYVEVFARRDIRDVLGVDAIDRFESFLRITAARTGREQNHSRVSRELGAPVNTVRRWSDALVRSYLLELVPAYSRNAGNRVIQSPKQFMVDSAFALAASREAAPSGFHLENLIASDMGAWREATPNRSLYHWRAGSGAEVDFVLEEDQKLVTVEVKSSHSVGTLDARHLQSFADKYSNTVRGLIVSSSPEIGRVRDGIVCAPWWAVV